MARDIRSGRPLHEQIRIWIEEHIRSGEWKPDQKLPSEHEISDLFGVSRVTVRRALQSLESNHTIYRCQGLGSFVANPQSPQHLVCLTDFMEDMKRAGLKASSRVVHTGFEQAPERVAERLGVEPGTKVLRLDRIRLGDGRPVAFDMTWFPLFYGQLLSDVDLGDRTLFDVFENEFQIPIKRGNYKISAMSATSYLADQLGVGEGQALLFVARVTFTLAEKVVYYQERTYRTDEVAYEIRLDRNEDGPCFPTSVFDAAPIREFTPVFKAG